MNMEGLTDREMLAAWDANERPRERRYRWPEWLWEELEIPILSVPGVRVVSSQRLGHGEVALVLEATDRGAERLAALTGVLLGGVR